MTHEELIAFVRENAGRRVRYRESSNQHSVVREGILIGYGNGQLDHALAGSEEYPETDLYSHVGHNSTHLTFVHGPPRNCYWCDASTIEFLDAGLHARPKWQRIGITKGLERLAQVESEVRR